MHPDDAASIVEIQQLAHRYALAADSRDLDALVALFVADVAVARGERGRDAFRAWYAAAMREVGATIHLVGNHVVDLDGEAATGVVYAREEVEELGTGVWRVGMLQYWDDYRRDDGRWLFVRRRVRRWYSVPADESPRRGAGVSADRAGAREQSLPEAFPSWGRFLAGELG